MNIRKAELKDIERLIKMRWDFTVEYDERGKITDSEFIRFHKECKNFLVDALNGQRWIIWIAEVNGEIVSHIYLELIQKVPRPGRITNPFVYMTNVYTEKKYRGKGIGSKLISQINNWSLEMKYEFIMVWPSEESIEFYKANGYKNCNEPLEFVFE
ncbi:GNAT family N-acetyltransferase [Bacillus sp. OAE603]|uniref:GNAT family N-acetyltransferase n=1 Tax=Gottfriedia sp. OAE603 TaxID=2663872 RepID=UPI001789B1AB